MNQEIRQERFDSFLKDHIGIIQKLCRGYTNSREDFEDNVQEVCYQLWRSIDRFEGKSKSSTWVYRLALNVCLNNLNRRKKQPDRPTEDEVIVKTLENKTESNEQEEMIAILYESIGKLKPIDRGIIMLYLEKKEYIEISEIVGLSVSNVGARISRIKQQLKKLINERSAAAVG
ncbi:MAG: sigma-70 family RNA polymerase sigma factor [Cyclobacteriaceae bacterium]